MRRAPLFVRGPRTVAAIRARFSRILPEPGAPPRPQHRLLHARPDAVAAADLPRVGPPRRLLRAAGARLFRDRPQGARTGQNSTGLSRSGAAENGLSER